MPRWVPEQAARLIHSELLAEHGGLHGPSREGALETALARPRQLTTYSKPTLPELDACYGMAFAKGHCFPDGNKRLALAMIDTFLQMNGHELVAQEVEAVAVIRAVADDAMSEPELAQWISNRMRRMRRR